MFDLRTLLAGLLGTALWNVTEYFDTPTPMAVAVSTMFAAILSAWFAKR